MNLYIISVLALALFNLALLVAWLSMNAHEIYTGYLEGDNNKIKQSLRPLIVFICAMGILVILLFIG